MRIKQLLIAVGIGTMLAACSSNDELSQDNSKDPIIISASIAGMQTRSTGDASELQNTAFKVGESINVYMFYASGDNQGNNIEGVPDKGYLTYTKGASGWTTDYVGSIYWPAGESVDFCGYYPSNVTNVTESFEVKEDQTLDADYRESDLMFASSYYYNHDPVILNFNHLLSKVTVKVNLNGLMSQDDFNKSLYDLHIRNISRTASITGDYDNKEANMTGEQDKWIHLYYDTTTGYNPTNGVSCILPPQTVAGGTQLIFLSINDESAYYYTVPEGITFEAGKEYIFTLKLKKSGIEMANISVTEWEEKSITGDAI